MQKLYEDMRNTYENQLCIFFTFVFLLLSFIFSIDRLSINFFSAESISKWKFIIFAAQRVVSSVGLEHYLDRVGVTGSIPVQPTFALRSVSVGGLFIFIRTFPFRID